MIDAARDTRLFTEAAESAEVVRRQLEQHGPRLAAIGRRLRQFDPALVLTCARGSSDHAATYAKYLIESRSGVFVASAAPSISSVYQRPMRFANSLCLLISQSGASTDILTFAEAAKAGGAYVVALTNAAHSPLAALADDVVELFAAPETSVAASKSFIGSLAALLQLVAAWQEDAELAAAVRSLPGLLDGAWQSRWPQALDVLRDRNSLLVLGRGLGLGVVQEAALKLKETCRMHAEAFSAAEVLHGPISIADRGDPLLIFSQPDETRPGVEKLLDELVERGLTLLTVGCERRGAVALPTPSAHPLLAPVLFALAFYRMVNELSLQRGLDPDHPPYLNKVTVTV